VRSTTTGGNGRYAVRLRDRAGRYRALARRLEVGDHTCFAAVSATRIRRHR
jgi:hypothetical protein